MKNKSNIFVGYLFIFLCCLAGCEKKRSPINQSNMAEQQANLEEHLFSEEKDSFRLVLETKIADFKAEAEDIDMRLFDYGDEMSIELRMELRELESDIRAYVQKLEQQLEVIALKKRENWEAFKLEARDRVYEAQLEFREMRLNMKESFQKP